MAVWDELKLVLLDLEGSGGLAAYPDPRMDEGREPPFGIDLAPWATDVAERLSCQFGDDVELTVGAFRYPERQPLRQPASASDDIAEIDPSELTVELDAPVVVASGRTIMGALRVHNMSAHTSVIATNGQLTAEVVDPQTGAVVGGFVGSQRLPLVHFRAAPGETVIVPLLVGTASFLPDLGYAIPAGEWMIQAIVKLDESGEAGRQRRVTGRVVSRRSRTPLLPITVTN
ncbi:MAG: hypothetical protein ABSG36_00675 [Acidimicrobiales bacterium]|jgi:hypothetical protein